jgi:hypothetical protein
MNAKGSGAAGVETCRLWATSFDSSNLALRIFHNSWQDCSQPRRGKQSTNHRRVLIGMNLALNVFLTDILCQEGVWLVVCWALRLRFSCFVVYPAVNVDKVRDCHCCIIYIKIVFCNNCRSKVIWSCNFLDDCVLLSGNNLMTLFNEFVKVHNEPKSILLHAWMQRKQQQYKIEILQVFKQSCTVSVMIFVHDMLRMQLSVYRTNSIIYGPYAPKILIFKSEFSGSVLLFCIVNVILHKPSALLISVTLCSCFRIIDKRMCVIDYINRSLHGWLPVIWVTNRLEW